MSTKSYTGLKEIIIAKLEALMDGAMPTPHTVFVAVYGSNVTEPEGYPIAYVMTKRGAGKIVDTGRNERTWEFSVVIHVAMGNKTEEEANTALEDAVDRVIQMFDRDPMLANTISGEEQCKKVEVAPVEVERAAQDVAVIRALLSVKVVDLVQRYA